MADNSVLIEFLLDDAQFAAGVEQASGAVDRLTVKVSGVKDPAKEVTGEFGNMGTAIAGVTAKLAGLLAVAESVKAAFEFFKDAVAKAGEEEDALNRVAGALGRLGDQSQDTLSGVTALSEGLSKSAGITQTASLGAFNLALSYGLTVEQAKKVTTQAADMSAALGIDLNNAVQQLSGTYNGHLGRLTKLNTGLSDLTEAQQKAGVAADMLGAQFAGAAASALNTFDGRVKLAKVSFEELTVAIGSTITQSTAVRAVVDTIGQVFDQLSKSVKDNKATIQEYIALGLRSLVENIRDAVYIVELLIKSMRGITTDNPLDQMNKGALSFRDAIADSRDFMATMLGYMIAARGVWLDMKSVVAAGVDNLLPFNRDGSKKEGTPAQDAVGKEQKANDDILQAIANLTTTIATQKGEQRVSDLPADQQPGVIKFNPDDPLLKGLDDLLAKLDSITDGKSPSGTGGPKVPDLFPPAKKDDYEPGYGGDPVDEDEDAKKKQDELTGQINALTTMVLDPKKGGAVGAGAAVAGVVGDASEALLPGSGAIVTPLTQMLEQGPEAIKGMIDQFTTALPGIVDNVAKAIPAMVEELAKNAGPIIVALSQAMPKVAIALAEAVLNPATWIGLVQGIVGEFTKGFAFEMPRFMAGFDNMSKTVGSAGATFGNQVRGGAEQFAQASNKAREDFLELPKTLANAAHVFGGQVIDAVHSLVTFFTKDVPQELMMGFMAALNFVITFFTKTLPKFLEGLPNAVWNAMSGAVTAFTKGLENAGTGFFNGIMEAATEFINYVTGKGSGGGKGVVAEAGSSISKGFKSIGLATGALVTGQGTGDTVPAMLTPGELVVDRTTGPRLNQFLDSYAHQNGSGDGGTSAVLLAQILDALKQPMQVSTTATVQGKALADIILNLNRTKARLT